MTEKSTPEDLAKEEALRHEKMEAEIANVLAETIKIGEENRNRPATHEAEITKLLAESRNLNTKNIHLAALTEKALNENKWYPAVIASGATLAIVAIVKIFL